MKSGAMSHEEQERMHAMLSHGNAWADIAAAMDRKEQTLRSYASKRGWRKGDGTTVLAKDAPPVTAVDYQVVQRDQVERCERLWDERMALIGMRRQ